MSDPGLEAVAVIGMSCRFPGASGIDEFWRNLRDGVESVRFFARGELVAAGVPPALLDAPSYVPAQATLAGPDLFDAGFFGFTPRMAEATDPQHRLFLECAWEALEAAGYDPAAVRRAIGLFAGTSINTYLLSNAANRERLVGLVGEQQAATGNRTDHLTTLVAYKLDLRGPAVTVQTTCSTALVAVHLACQSLLTYQCHMALAGGARVMVPQTAGYLYQPGDINSPDGHCRPFDAAAQGTLIGSGAGAVLLKRLADAVKDRDEIHAVIRGTAVNNDGAHKVGYTAPSADGQAKVIATAQAVAGVRPDEIGYIEAHGTGTPLGDPIELAALTRVFRAKTARRGFCALGAVKSNFGHLDTAAGIAGLIKTTLVLKHGQIPPTLHFTKPNPELRLEESPFYVPAALTEWMPEAGPRRAGVSAFGIGGTNAHAILEEPPAAAPSGPSRPAQLLLLSARTATALEAMTGNLRRHLEERTNQELADVAYTLRAGRRAFEVRRATVCRDREEAVERLGTLHPFQVHTSLQQPRQRPVTFLFPGQGAQRVRMGAELYAVEEVFRREVDRCAEALLPWLGLDVRRELLAPEAESRLEETFLTQPALFVVEYALARLWMAWGITPRAMIGHSLGEYVAACLAGVFSLDDALRLVAGRGRLMQDLPPGAMLSVQLAEADLRNRLSADLSVAAVNRPSLCVVSGPAAEVDELERRLSAEGVACRRLRTRRAFHSAMVEPALAPFAELLATVALQPPVIPFVSNLTGRFILPEEATDPGYWVRHLREAVRFGDGLETVLRQGEGILLEVGPGRTLSSIVRQHPAWTVDHLVLASLQHRQEDAEMTALLTSLGRLWVAGTEIDWNAFHGVEQRRRVTLPTYPFERRRYWLETATEDGGGLPLAVRGEWQKDLADWFWLPSWRRTTPAGLLRREALEPGRRWLLFVDAAGLGEELAARLEKLGQEVARVAAGVGFQQEDGRFTLDPGRPEDYRALVAALRAEGGLPQRIVHLWSTAPADAGLDRGFFSLLYLAQALGTGEGEPPVRIDAVSTGMQEVAGGDLRAPEKAALLGPCKVLPKEYAGLSCRSIDLSEPGEIEALLSELLSAGSEKMVAHRGGHRWVQSFEPVRLEPADGSGSSGLRPGGVYLITGGFGGMGSTLAAYLAQSWSAKLILTGRSPLPPRGEWEGWLAAHGEEDAASRKIRQVQTLEAGGAEVLAAGVDIADGKGMRSLLAAARERFGPLHGVFHTAGISPGGLAQLKTGEAALRTFSPKVEGTRVLAGLLTGEDLDFFLLCSSRSAIFGPAGGIDYAAANAFLDAFAHSARSAGIPRAVSVNWCGWDEVGMMAEAHARRDKPADDGEPDFQPVSHPLLDRRRVEPGRETYLAEFSARTRWVLNEHRIVGNPVVPGTTYLEMARAAAALRGMERIELRDVYFLTPLRLREDESCDVRLILEENEDRLEFQVASRPRSGGDWQKHVLGRIEALAPEAAAEEPGRRDVEALRRRCAGREVLASARDEQNEDFGPRWQNVTRVSVGDGEVFASLELSEAFAGDLASCALHPALLDRGASIGEDYLGDGAGRLPFSYGSLRLLAPVPRRIYSHARLTSREQSRGETISFDVDLMDEDGNVVVEARRYHKKRINDTAEKLRLPEAASSSEEPAPPAARTGITPAEGLEVFRRILAHPGAAQIVVSPNNLLEAIAAEEAYRPPRLDGAGSTEAGSAAPQHGRPDLGTLYAAPETDLQARLATIWREVLGFREVGIQDNFFELGGDSILAIQIIARARKAGIEISPGEIFEHQTIAELAARLVRLEQGGGPAGELSAPPIAPIAPVLRGGDLPLSFAQERLWFLARLAPDSPAYNVPAAIRMTGPLDPAALAAGLRAVVRRHEVLRTRFAAVEGRPVQIVEPAGSPALAAFPLMDLSGLAPERREAELRGLIAAEAARLFDLGRSPLLRLTLFRLGAGEHLLLSVFHHAVVDGWSLGLFLAELQEIYTARAAGRPSRLADLPVQYADYAAWQRSWLSGEVLERKLDFWRRNLEGAPTVLDLATDHPRPAVQRFRAGTWTFRLPAALGRRKDATLFMTLLASFAALLARRSGQEDLLVGTTVANRDRPGLEGMIGMFVNTLPLRVDLAGDPSFPDLLGRVQRMLPEVFANQDLPFEKLVEALDLPRSLRHAPLVQAVLVLRSFPPVEPMGLEGLRFEPWYVEAAGAQFDLSLVAGDSEEGEGGGLRCLFEYDRDLFDAPTIQRLAGHLAELMRGAAAAPERRLSELPLLSPAERHQTLAEWNDTEAPLPEETILARIAEQVRRAPGAVAVTDETAEAAEMTYADLDRAAGRLAGRLRALGARPESLVAVVLERSSALVVALLATLQAGAAYVPLDPDAPRERLAAMLTDCGDEILLTSQQIAARLPRSAARVVLIDSEGESPATAMTPAGPENTAYLIYTSGSTGRPKGVVNSHRGLLNRLLWMQTTFGLTADDRVLQKTPYTFDVSVWEFFWPLMVGARLVVARPGGHRDPAYLTALIARQGVTVLHFVPSLLRLFLEEPSLAACRSLRLVFASGEALPADLQDRFYQHFAAGTALHNLYGPTEAAIDVTAWPCARPAEGEATERVPIGRPVSNTAIRILDRRLHPVPLGVPGELCIGGVQLARGYSGRPDLTAERFVPDPVDTAGGRLYRTGDLARFLPDGAVEYLGRIDFQVKIRGVRIEPGEIEAALLALPGIHEAVVVAREDRLIAYVVADEADFPDAASLRGRLAETLPEAMIPAAFVRLDALPRTPAGKLDRRGLPDPGSPERPVAGHGAPRTPLEEKLAALFTALLGVPEVGRGESFFALGGHSLLAAQLVARLRAELGVEVPLGRIFQTPTVESLAAEVGLLQSGSPLGDEIPRHPAGPSPLSFAQQRLWLVDQMEAESPFYNIVSAVRLRGPLRVDLLRRAADEIVRRHESLRTVFTSLGGEPRQVVQPPQTADLPLIDLGELEAREEITTHLAQEEARGAFDLTRGPLSRGRLVRLAENKHVLLWVVHHIVADWWSVEMLIRELTALYGAFLRGEAPALAELPIQYRDYAAWQRQRAEEGALDEARSYWLQQLAGAPPVLTLATDRPRPARQSFRGARLTAGLPRELGRSIAALADREESTLFTALLAAFAVLLHHASGAEDLLVGAPFGARQRAEIAGLIGLFVNALPLRIDLSGDPSFRALLGRVRRAVLAALQQQHMPFEKLVEELQPERRPGYNPLFQVTFNLIEGDLTQPLTMPGLEVEPISLASELTQFDLSLTLLRRGPNLTATFEYSTELFDTLTVAWRVEDLRHLLDAVTADPDLPLHSLRALLTAAETERRAALAKEVQSARRESFGARRRQAVTLPGTPE